MQFFNVPKKFKIIWAVVAALSVLLVVSYFLPLLSPTSELKDAAGAAEKLFGSGVDNVKGVTKGDLLHPSVHSISKIMRLATDIDMDETIAAVGFIFTLFLIVAIIILVFAALKLPVGVLVFDIFAALLSLLYAFFTGAMIEGVSFYKKGIAVPLMLILELALFIAAIMFIKEKAAFKATSKMGQAQMPYGQQPQMPYGQQPQQPQFPQNNQ